MNLNTPRGRHFDFAAAAAAARSVADASAGSVDGLDAVAKDAAVALIMANDAKGEKQLRKALEAQNRAITALLADREVRVGDGSTRSAWRWRTSRRLPPRGSRRRASRLEGRRRPSRLRRSTGRNTSGMRGGSWTR